MTAGLTYLLRRHEERQELRAVARLLLDELSVADGDYKGLARGLKDDHFVKRLRDSELVRHRLALARGLSHRDHRHLRAAWAYPLVLGWRLERAKSDGEREQLVRETLDELRKAEELLAAHAGLSPPRRLSEMQALFERRRGGW